MVILIIVEKCGISEVLKKYVINKVSKTINIFQKSIKTRKTLELSDEWISPSKTRNYALNDTFLDYCKEYNVTDITILQEKY